MNTTFAVRSLIRAFCGILLCLARRSEAAEGAGAAATAAQVAHPVQEVQLATVTLAPQASARLGLETAQVETRRDVLATRLYAGEVLFPFAGSGGAMAPLWNGSWESLLQLATAQAEAEGRIRQAHIQLESAGATYERTVKLQDVEAASPQALELARERFEMAQSALQTAREARALLGEAVPAQELAPRLWVRVKVYAGDLAQLDRNATVDVRRLAQRPGQETLRASPAKGPPTANHATGAVDWYYQLESSPPELHIGERVAVLVPMGRREETHLVPFRAVVQDIQGGQWVYEQLSTNTYTRRRVLIERVLGEEAVLAEGPAPGTSVVVAGAAELFGIEFGAGK